MEKTKLSKGIAALVAAVILAAVCLAGCGSDKDNRVYRTYDEIKEDGKVSIGVSSDNIPFGYAGEDGQYRGFEIQFAERLSKELGVKAEFVSVENEDRARYLETGKVDIIIAAYATDATAKKSVSFADAYMKTALGAVASDKSKISGIEDLGKKDKVIVVSGSDAAAFMTKNYPDVKLSECADENEAIDALLGNKGVMWLGDNYKTAEFAMQNDGYSVVSYELGEPVKYAPAVSKGNSTLVKEINKVLKKLDKEDFFRKDYNDTLSIVYGPEFEDIIVIEPKQEPEKETETTTETETAAQTETKTETKAETKSE